MATTVGGREGFVTVNGLRLHYVDWGNPARPHLLLVHGWDGTARYWDLVAPAFCERFHVVALTLRGRGQSAVDPTGEYRFADYLSDLWEATQQLGMHRLTFVGASLGGLLALPYTAQHAPQVEKLALVDIGAQLGGERPSSYYAGMLNTPEQFATLQDAEDWLRQWSLYVKLPAEGMAIVLREHFAPTAAGGWTWRFGHRLRTIQRAQAREQLFPTQWHVLSQVSCPVLLVHGSCSESLLPEVAERTCSTLPRATLVTIPDCSHFPFLENPAALIKALRDFVG